MKKQKKNLILVPAGAKKKIAARLDCGRNAVSNALQYKDTGNELANLIRETAIKEFGGCLTSIMV